MNESLNKLGKFEITSFINPTQISLDLIKEGLNDIGNYIIKCTDGRIDYVIDKVCDHAGGRLIVKNNKAVCPMHNWTLDLTDLKYDNSHICKKELDFKIIDHKILLDSTISSLKNPFKNLNKENVKVKFRWLNHATIWFEFNGFTLITDPWLFGPAFMTGWWLSTPSTIDSEDLLKNADIVYISHNHPDHLHPETLACLDKNKQFIVPNFQTKSCENYLNKLGFFNIIPLDFNDIYEFQKGIQISILKSGDFRDDSGIYLNINNNEFLLAVDCNFLNSNVLPKDIDFLLTSFAGGASGFPLCFDDYNEDEKNVILNRNKSSIKFNVNNYLKHTNPKFYMPYAGMFSENSDRDYYIKERNLKNTFDDYQKLCNKRGTNILEPNSKIIYVIDRDEVLTENLSVDIFSPENTNFYIDSFKSEYKLSSKIVLEYFIKSKFKDDLILQIIPTDDNFKSIVDYFFYIDFKNDIYEKRKLKDLKNQINQCQLSTFRIRYEILMCVIYNSLPWEDISIGFQLRINRFPNTYESKFWYYFTNEYIAKENIRYSIFCGACTVVNQNPIWCKID